MWTSGMVKKILINPIYTGTMVNHKTENTIVAVKSGKSLPREERICISDTHEAIVSMEEFNKVLSMEKGLPLIRKGKFREISFGVNYVVDIVNVCSGFGMKKDKKECGLPVTLLCGFLKHRVKKSLLFRGD